MVLVLPLPGVFELNFVQNSSTISWGDCFFIFLGFRGIDTLGCDMDVFKKYLRSTLRALFSFNELSESEESPMMG